MCPGLPLPSLGVSDTNSPSSGASGSPITFGSIYTGTAADNAASPVVSVANSLSSWIPWIAGAVVLVILLKQL